MFHDSQFPLFKGAVDFNRRFLQMFAAQLIDVNPLLTPRWGIFISSAFEGGGAYLRGGGAHSI